MTLGREFPTRALSIGEVGASFHHRPRCRKPPAHPGPSAFPRPVGSQGCGGLLATQPSLTPGGLRARSPTPLLRLVSCTARQRLRLPPQSSPQSRVVSPTWPSLSREPLRLLGVFPRREACPHDLGQHSPARVAPPGSCASPPPSHVLRMLAWYGSLCRLPRAPCWTEALPAVLPSISVAVLGPVPRRAAAVPRPVASRRPSASPYVHEVRRADPPARLATAMTNRLRGCSHAVLCRLPHLRAPQVAPTAEAQSPLGSRAVYTTPCTCGDPPRTVVSLRA